LNIIDASLINSLGAKHEPVKPEMLVISTNCVAADNIVCQLAGINPSEIKYMKKAQESGFGNLEVKLSDVKKVFDSR
jgi:uncharacterized protein (DUF362 family)